MLVLDFPLTAVFGERIGADAVLPFVGAVAGGYADQLIHQQVADVFPHIARQNGALVAAFHLLQFGDHHFVVLDAVFRQNAFVVGDDHRILGVIGQDFFGGLTYLLIHLFQNIDQGILVIAGTGSTRRKGHSRQHGKGGQGSNNIQHETSPFIQKISLQVMCKINCPELFRENSRNKFPRAHHRSPSRTLQSPPGW